MYQAFSTPIPGVDWDQMSLHFTKMIDRMFDRNGWTDESDQFAKKVSTRVAAIPPWDLAGRFAALSDEVSERYGLTPQQTTMFERAVMRESGVFLMKHGTEIWKQGKEALLGRSQGKPYTAEQVARWARDADPLFEEIEICIERVAGELEQTLSDEKKGVLQKDMAGFHKRHKDVVEMNHHWAKGLWKPDEWGLEDDPIQTGGARTAAKQSDPAPAPTSSPPAAHPIAPLVTPTIVAAPLPDHWVEHDPTTWIALVIEIGRKFRLDGGQMDTAWSIHAELVERASRYSKAHSTELAAVPPTERKTNEAYGPIRELFTELRDRLESLPSSAQREANRK